MKKVKVACAKSNVKLVLQVSDDGKEILGYYKLKPEDFEAVQSEVRLAPNASTRARCSSCGASTFGACEHRYSRAKCGTSAQTLAVPECLVCKHLTPVYGRAKAGGCVQIKRGECVGLDLTKLRIGVNWDSVLDIDTSVVLCGNGTSELVYFGDQDSDDRSVHHRGDNLRGSTYHIEGCDDAENMDVRLDRVSSSFDRIVFVINIYSGASKFGRVNGLALSIYDADSNEKLVSYNVEQDFYNDRSLIIGEAHRTAGGWEFKAIGEGSRIGNVHDLASYVAGNRF